MTCRLTIELYYNSEQTSANTLIGLIEDAGVHRALGVTNYDWSDENVKDDLEPVEEEPDMPVDTLYEAYMEGQADFAEGKTEKQCPYPDGHLLRSEWLRGWETMRCESDIGRP